MAQAVRVRVRARLRVIYLCEGVWYLPRGGADDMGYEGVRFVCLDAPGPRVIQAGWVPAPRWRMRTWPWRSAACPGSRPSPASLRSPVTHPMGKGGGGGGGGGGGRGAGERATT